MPMTCRKTPSFATAAALFLGCAWPPAAGAATLVSSDGPIACQDFQRGANGTWTVVRATTIAPKGKAISLSPGQSFAKNQWVDGIEVTNVLDRNCGNQ
jgi:hypothetical protein